MKRDHRREVAGHAAVVRTALTDLESHGRTVPPAAWAALAAVDDWLGGNDVPGEVLQAAADLSFQTGVPLAGRESDRALSWARTAAGNLAWFAKKDRGWQTGGTAILDAAVYALSSLGIPGVKDHGPLEAMYAEAHAAAPRSKGKATKRPPTVDLSAFIGVAANKRLQRLTPVFVPEGRDSPEALRALLHERGYTPHDAVFAFDARYGGLVAADSPGEAGRDWTFGAWACLQSGAHVNPRGALATWIPVAYSPNDYVVFLDEHGVSWMTDTVGDDPTERFADDPDAMMARFLGDRS